MTTLHDSANDIKFGFSSTQSDRSVFAKPFIVLLRLKRKAVTTIAVMLDFRITKVSLKIALSFLAFGVLSSTATQDALS